jgi:BTB/POZ domain
MASSEKFCLRWNDFESNISVAFRELRDEKDFFDITLAVEDSQQVQAHKVILSACSPFFRQAVFIHHYKLMIRRMLAFFRIRSQIKKGTGLRYCTFLLSIFVRYENYRYMLSLVQNSFFAVP